MNRLNENFVSIVGSRSRSLMLRKLLLQQGEARAAERARLKREGIAKCRAEQERQKQERDAAKVCYVDS